MTTFEKIGEVCEITETIKTSRTKEDIEKERAELQVRIKVLDGMLKIFN